jgi:hypothetical protein
MWRRIAAAVERFQRSRYRAGVERALALQGEGRPDGLTLVRVRNRLEVRWRSRDIHPWDNPLSDDGKAQLFQEQLARDTEAAILRLFQSLPAIDRIDLQVLDPATDTVLLGGEVHRSALNTIRSVTSVRMRLHQLGVTQNP